MRDPDPGPDGPQPGPDGPQPGPDGPQPGPRDQHPAPHHPYPGPRDPNPEPGDREIGEELAGWGKVLLLETRGRVTGRPVRTAVGFVEREDGSLLIAAGAPDADWARNLEADPRCRVTIEDRTEDRVAIPLDAEERNAAIVALILRYGTPAERLGAGPAFRLVRLPESS